ncbi:MAG: hypothetical protein OTJ97_10820 [SAR202 cluster bacterium]|nr:hypothetical protein [SAR202 cluster bacterium]
MSNAYRWSCVSSEVAWSPRDGAQLVSFQGKLFLLGGWNQYAGERTDLAGAGTGSFESEVCSEVWCSDDDGRWYLAATAPWSGRHMHGAVVHDGHIWVIGAENGTPDDVWKSKDGVHWQLVAATVPWPERGNQLVTVFDGSIWVMGGQTGAAGQSNFVADLKAGKPFPPAPPPLCDVWRTKDGLRWELMTDDAPWAPRGMITGANGGVPVLDGRMWILGGGYVGTGGTTLSTLRYDLEQQPRLETRLFHNDVWSSADGREWICHIADGMAPWPARSYHDTAAWDGKLWVLGGHRGVADHAAEIGTDGNRNDVWYSADGEHWQKLPLTPWSSRHACAIHVHDDALFLAAGNAVTISAEQVELGKRDFTHRVEAVWRPGDVWRLDRAAVTGQL